MAGISKPIVDNLGNEVSMTIHSYSLQQLTSPLGLVDGTQVNEWNTERVAYWNTGNYIEVSFDKKVNIWRSGTLSWATYITELIIKKYNGSTYEDVTDLYSLPTTAIDNTDWEMFVKELPKGQYRFEIPNGLRIDSEWYIEDCRHYFNGILNTGNFDELKILKSANYENDDVVRKDYIGDIENLETAKYMVVDNVITDKVKTEEIASNITSQANTVEVKYIAVPDEGYVNEVDIVDKVSNVLTSTKSLNYVKDSAEGKLYNIPLDFEFINAKV